MQKCLHDVFNLGLRLQELNPQSIVFVINLLSRAVVSQLAMNVLEQIECELSAESDLSVVEDDFNNASEDDDYRELSHESDIMANSSSSSTSRSTCLESASNSSSSTSRSNAVSLLSVLKAPTVSDLSRKRKMARNPAPVGKRRARASGGSLMQQLCLIGPMLLRRFWPFNLPQLLQRECFHC